MTAPIDDASRPVDVGEARRRVQAAGRATRAEGAMTPERMRAVMRARAKALALTEIAQVDRETLLEAVSFTLAGERYAIETRMIVELLRLTDLTTLPGATPPVLGLTAWRGRLLTVMDLRAALGAPTSALNDMGYVIVIGNETAAGRARAAAFGVLADALHGIVALPLAEVRAPPDGLSQRRGTIRGITPDAVLVIDAAQLVREFGGTSQGERTT